ncbi:MAG: TIR domain-containing protein [Chloroflexota bacterium]
MPERKLRVFLCHASQDKHVVRELYRRLDDEGWIDPWLDEKKILAGQDWDLEIQKAVRGSDVILVGFSKASVNKEGYVQKEIRLALDVAEEKPEGTIFIIPVRFENCLLPLRLSIYHWVNYFEPDGYRQIIKSLQSRAISLSLSITYRVPLSDREAEVLLLLAKGMQNKEIGQQLGISYQTVKNHVSSIYSKLNVNTRSQAVAYAFQHGLV